MSAHEAQRMHGPMKCSPCMSARGPLHAWAHEMQPRLQPAKHSFRMLPACLWVGGRAGVYRVSGYSGQVALLLFHGLV